MNVIQAIIALLYEHDTVIVPALGAFVRHDEGAQVNVVTNEFQKPSSTIAFDPSQHEENPLIIEYLMQHGERSDEEARQQIAAFVADCYAKMREGETVTLEGLGTLSLNGLQEPVFEAEPSCDFNPDTFGLSDLEATPVYRVEPKEPKEPTKETVERPKELARGGTGPQEEPRRKTWWIWLLLMMFILGGLALWYFKFRPVKPEPVTPIPTDTVTLTPVDTVTLPTDTLTSPADTIAQDTVGLETINEPTPNINEPVPPTEVVKPEIESKAFIVGGCFSVEQNALNMAMEAYDQGCKEAFVMKRGSKFFVCYGQYPTAAEAKQALPSILQNYNQKAWILVK